MNNPKENKTILVVDDEAMLLDILGTFIGKQGYQVLLAKSGHEALEVAKEYAGKVDLLLTDIMMPNMNGLELAKTLVATDPDIKVIFMSGHLQSAIDSQNTPCFRDGFIQKPFSYDTLKTYIKKTLNEMD